jgi:hypothetical protein
MMCPSTKYVKSHFQITTTDPICRNIEIHLEMKNAVVIHVSRGLKMSSSGQRVVLTVAVSSAILVLAGGCYLYRESIWDTIEYWTCSEKDATTIELLGRINTAIDLVVETANRIDKMTKEERSKSTGDMGQLSGDLDFIYAELDSVRGGEGVKQRRKRLVARAHAVTKMLESWSQ